MASTNKNKEPKKAETYEGGWAWPHLKPIDQLRRCVLSCMLWEDEFYERGVKVADRIVKLASKVEPHELAGLAIDARTEFKLRHVPLMLVACLDKFADRKLSGKVQVTITDVINRPDEIPELLMIQGGLNERKPRVFSHAMRKGLQAAWDKFDPYQIAKWKMEGKAMTLRDAMILTHPKPRADMEETFRQLHDGTLKQRDTWEDELSAGGKAKDVFEGLLNRNKLPYLALLRNLRKMEQAGVDHGLIRKALIARKGAHWVLPFRYVAAAKHAPRFEDAIDEAFVGALRDSQKLIGKTVVIIDISGSMDAALSSKSDMTRKDAACALGAICREICEEAAIYATAGNDGLQKHATAMVPARHGMALVDGIYAMRSSLGHGGIFTKQALEFIAKKEGTEADRVIIITDEQDTDQSRSPLNNVTWGNRNYLINVASARNGIGYGEGWTAHLSGFSEKVFDFIRSIEDLDLQGSAQ